MARNIDASTMDMQERVVAINRVSKTVKGGRVMKFSALVRFRLWAPPAGIAHLVERHLAKVEVASSSLVARSR